jgi:hypothetical protein
MAASSTNMNRTALGGGGGAGGGASCGGTGTGARVLAASDSSALFDEQSEKPLDDDYEPISVRVFVDTFPFCISAALFGR